MNAVGKFTRWLAVVSPPAWSIVFALAMWSAFESVHLFTVTLHAEPEALATGHLSAGLVIALSMSYAVFRGFAFHPGVRTDYLRWLSLTPWRYPKPLPLGPVQVVAQDFVFLALLELMLWDAPLEMRFLMPGIFFFTLLVCWTLPLWVTGYRRQAYVLAFVLATIYWLASLSQLAAIVCLVPTYALAWRYLVRSFATFPWGEQPWLLRMGRSVAKKGSFQLGHPFDALSPRLKLRLPLDDRLVLSVLVGWSLFAFLSHNPTVLIVLAQIQSPFLGFIIAMWETARYVEHHAPPINLFGRLFTGRWLIPSYDVAFLPLIYFFCVMGAACTFISAPVGAPAHYVVPAACTLFLLLIQLACPDINRWRLTCQARVHTAAYGISKTEFEHL